MLTAAPPAVPKTHLPVDQRNRKYYTIHSSKNNAFTLKLGEEVRTAIVGFANIDDAFRIGNMIETHFVEKREWPDTTQTGTIFLPSGKIEDLSHIFIHQWTFDELKIECTRNILDMVSVDAIIEKKSAYSFSGNLYRFHADVDFYKLRFDEIYCL